MMLLAIGAIVVLRWFPQGRVVLYPLTLFATWVHEMGHGLTAIAVGGHFHTLAIFSDASGLATSSRPAGVASAMVALGGLWAPPVVGCALLLLSRSARWARVLLSFLVVAIVISLVLWVRTFVGVALLLPLAFALVWIARRADSAGGLFVTQLLGFALALDTVGRIDYLFESSVVVDGKTNASDIASVAAGFGGPQFFWSALIASGSLLFVGVTGWLALRRLSASLPDAT